MQAAADASEVAAYFPHFLWVVRDFSVRLERDGKRITSNDYLEDALKPEPPGNASVEQKNAVRTAIRSYFPQRDCVTMVCTPSVVWRML